MNEAAKEGVAVPASAFEKFDRLLAQSKELFDRENYQGAKQLAKQAKKSLEVVKDAAEDLKEAEEQEEELKEGQEEKIGERDEKESERLKKNRSAPKRQPKKLKSVCGTLRTRTERGLVTVQ